MLTSGRQCLISLPEPNHSARNSLVGAPASASAVVWPGSLPELPAMCARNQTSSSCKINVVEDCPQRIARLSSGSKTCTSLLHTKPLKSVATGGRRGLRGHQTFDSMGLRASPVAESRPGRKPNSIFDTRVTFGALTNPSCNGRPGNPSQRTLGTWPK